MSHLKRRKTPKTWPVPKKGTKYIVRPNFGLNKGLPILIILRDILKIAQNKKEVKRAIQKRNILLNNNLIKSEKDVVQLFDKITLIPSKKYFQLTLDDHGKFCVEEIKKGDVDKKISKISNKKTLKKKKTQINLSDGRNYINDIKCNVNDSVIIDLKNKKITKCLPLKEKANVLVINGKHSGKRGKIERIIDEMKMAELKIGGEKINVLIKQIMVIE